MEYQNIVIVGNTNVGKSLLFNKICGGDYALVYNKENTTLDYISIYIDNKKITDTAGIIKYNEWLDLYGNKILTSADLILYVCDISKPITFEIEDLFRKLHSMKKDIWIICNKSDRKQHEDFTLDKLNADMIFYVSAIENKGISELLKHMGIVRNINTPKNLVAIVGRANAGKSTLMNHILGNNRSIVSDKAGTTVDHIQENKTINNIDITFIDTPGFTNNKDSFMSTINKRRTDLLKNTFIGQIVVIDAEIGVTKQDKAIIDQAQYQGLFTIICVNKYDKITLYVKEQLKHINVPKHIERFNIAAINGTGISKMLKSLAESIEHFHKFTTPTLNKFMSVLKSKENMSKNISQIKYMLQTNTHPITILYFAPHPLSIYDMKCVKKYMMEYFNIKNYRILLQHKYTS